MTTLVILKEHGLFMEQQYQNYLTELSLLGDYLEEGSLQGWSYSLRKNILLLLHKLITTSRKLANTKLEDELVALEFSLGFGAGTDFEPERSRVEDHQLRILELIDNSEQAVNVEIVIESETTNDTKSVYENEIMDETELIDEDKIKLLPEETNVYQVVPVGLDTDKDKMTEQGVIQLVMCYCPGRDAARELARHLIKARLAACVNIIANIGSIYWWKGEIHDTAECQLQIKTSHQSLNDTIDYIRQHHPDDIPEILVIPINEGNKEYFEWVKRETYDRE
ncbi:MAG: divalent-cation tolerance protein CutA [Gammaproteobacteria bacterium]|nr:divalent-cation tolerance protein CutA [Gammaproteobacteria bacterium]